MNRPGSAHRVWWGRRASFPLVFFAVLAAVQISAPAQTTPPQAAVGVEITPARIQRDLPTRAVSLEVTVVNHEDEPRRIKLSVTGLGHDLEGSPQYFEQGDTAAQALSLSAGDVVLGAKEQKKVAVTGAIPASARALYAAVVAEFSPLSPPPGQIEVRSRVASLLLLRGPKPWTERVEVVDAGMFSSERGPARIFAAIKNTGNVHVKPTGSVRIVQSGRALATVPLKSENVLPGFSRRLYGVWTPPKGFSGTVTFEVVTKNPNATGSKTAALGPGSAATAQAEIVNLRARGDEGGEVSLQVRNVGGVEINPVVTLFAKDGDVERARTVLPQKALAPGAMQEVTWKPALSDGLYLITAQVKSDEDLLDEDVTDLRIGSAASGPLGPGASAGRSGRVPLVIAAIVLLALVAGILGWLWFRNRNGSTTTAAPLVAKDRERETVGASR